MCEFDDVRLKSTLDKPLSKADIVEGLQGLLQRWHMEDLVEAGLPCEHLLEGPELAWGPFPGHDKEDTPDELLRIMEKRNSYSIGIETYADREGLLLEENDENDLFYDEQLKISEYLVPAIRGLDFITNIGSKVRFYSGKKGSWGKQILDKDTMSSIDYGDLIQTCERAVLNWVDILDYEMTPKRNGLRVYLNPYVITNYSDFRDKYPRLAVEVVVFGKIVSYMDTILSQTVKVHKDTPVGVSVLARSTVWKGTKDERTFYYHG